jgi:hypothetical protein
MPQRLVHPKCFAEEHGFDELMNVVTAYDQRIRMEEARRFRDSLERGDTNSNA